MRNRGTLLILMVGLAFSQVSWSQELPYPIIFIHGIISNSDIWVESGLTSFLQDDAHLGEFTRLDICLERDGDWKNPNLKADTAYFFEVGKVPKRNYYLINFDVNPDGSLNTRVKSNQAAITKQGAVLQKGIAAVLQATQKEKVILVGHSMGGLAAREYIQNPAWHQPDGKSHVAQLVTIGTPHLGSNAAEVSGIVIPDLDSNSDASRDLAYDYDFSISRAPDPNLDNAVYLFGGFESQAVGHGFHSIDINCNGVDDVNPITGLNERLWPSDVRYFFLRGRHRAFNYNSDGAVRFDRQMPYLEAANKTLEDVYHSSTFFRFFLGLPYTYELQKVQDIIFAMDEPDDSRNAYRIAVNVSYAGFYAHENSGSIGDRDWYQFTLPQSGNILMRFFDYPLNGANASAQLRLLTNDSPARQIASAANTGGGRLIELEVKNLTAGEYLVELFTSGTDAEQSQPYFFSILSIGAPTQISMVPLNVSLPTNPTAQKQIFAELRDSKGRIVTSATNSITFTITAGAASATLVGPNPVNAVKGVATITLQSTTTPGLVTIEASSPGLTSATTTVSVYSNPTPVSGAITTNTTWALAKSPYQVTGDIDVRTGITLTIDPGVTVLFNGGTDITVNGTLVANGTAGQHIAFTSSSANPVVGAWGGLRINAPQGSTRSSLRYCDFSYGGQGGYGNYDDVFEISGYADPQVSSCTIVNSRRNGIEILGGDYNSDFRISITGLPLMLLGDLSVGQSARMTIGAGVHLKFGGGADLYVHGALAAEGTPSSRIIFTSLRDDAVNGDTGGDGPTSGNMGDWGGIYFNDTINDAQCKLTYCDVKFAGQGGYGNLDAAIRMDARANPTFTSLRFTNCRYNGIDIETEDYSTNISFNQTAAPYILRGDLGVQKGAVLTIAPGTLFKLTGGSDIRISGGLVCQGTAGSPIRFTSIRDDSRGGDSGNDGQTAGSAGEWGGIYFDQTVRASRMNFCELYYGGGGGYGNLGRPALLDLRAEVTFFNLTIANCTSNGIAIRDVEYNSDTRLRFPGNTPYLQFGDITIASGTKFIIEPGCILKLSGGSDLYINGGLKAEGTAASPIIFTSLEDDSLLGDSNNDGNSLGLPGQWGGIAFGSSAVDSLSRMRNCRFRFGGGGGYGNVGWVVQVSPLVNPLFENLRFIKNIANGIRLADGTYASDITFDQTAAPYLLSGDYSIEASGGLTIAAGTLFKCFGGSDIYVKSRLTAVGTATTPIIFTSIRDDRYAGDTNNDGASKGVAGDWGGIVFQSQSVAGASEVAYCEFWYGAGAGYGNSDAALRFESASQKVHHVKVRQMRWHGVRAEGNASPDLGGGAYLSPGNNSFLDFNIAADRYAVFNDGSATIFAKNNTWDGSTVAAIAQEIYDKTDNASKGEVIFQPFIPAGDNEAPRVSVLFPNGGETLLRGKAATLRWYVRDNVGVTQIDVALSRDGGQVFQPLTSFTSQQDEYVWTVAGPFSSRCILKVTGRDAAGNERFDVSDNFFAIVDFAAGVNYPPSIPLPLRPLAGEEMRSSDLLIWQASVDPNPFDEIRYRLEIDNNANFSSPELVEDNIDSSRTGIVSEAMKLAIPAGGNVIAIRLDRLAGFANLQDDVVYYWRLRARDKENATSAFSDGKARFFMNKINTPPQAVARGFSPTNNLEVRAARPTISWQAAHDPDPSDTPNVLQYLLQMDDDGEFLNDVEILAHTNPGVTFYIPTQDLRENARYSYRVQASDDEGAVSPWSSAQSFFVNAIKEPPKLFEILAPAPIFTSRSDTVICRWQATTDPDPFDSLRYVVEWSTDSLFATANRLSFRATITQTVIARPPQVDQIFWRLFAVDSDSLITFASNSQQQPRRIRWITAVAAQEKNLPTEFSLAQNHPNPFNPETTIEFSLPQSSDVQVEIFDMLGKHVRTLFKGHRQAGRYAIIWDGRDENGQIVSSGIFIYQLRAGKFVQSRKMLLLQ